MRKFKQILTYIALGLLVVGAFFYLKNRSQEEVVNDIVTEVSSYTNTEELITEA